MDQQIWMVGVLSKYFVNQVLRFNHQDFMRALRQDLAPLLGEMGMWVLTNYANRQQEKGKTEKRKMALVCVDIIKKYIEEGYDYLGKEGKYNLINKFGPKKCPAQQIHREHLPFLYSWMHYAPQTWYKHVKKLEEEMKSEAEKRKNPDAFKKCTFCSAPESELRKHKVCSACKQAFYCSADCQRYDWQKKHKTECKELQKAAAKK
jgi:MYND finger